MTLSPICLFVYKRPEHLLRTINSLKKNFLAASSELFVFSDGPKNFNDEKKVNEVRDIIKNIDGFKNIEITLNNVNMGLANSIINGVTQILKNYDKAIILEDDLVFSELFLNYMNDALNYYKNTKNIYSISGYTYPITIPNNYHYDVFLLPRASSWGWGTWRNRWENVDWEINDFDDFIIDNNRIKNFNTGGDDLTRMLENQIMGKIDSWAIRWTYWHFKNNSYCLFPVKSLVNNIGNDSSGTNLKKTNKYKSIIDHNFYPNLDPLEPNNEIIENLQVLFSKIWIQKMFYRIKKMLLK